MPWHQSRSKARHRAVALGVYPGRVGDYPGTALLPISAKQESAIDRQRDCFGG